MVTVVFSENNSGGSWWLPENAYDKLRSHGWEIEGQSRPLLEARKEFESLRAGVEEWEEITGHDAAAVGCTCCGRPFHFHTEDENGKWLKTFEVTIVGRPVW